MRTGSIGKKTGNITVMSPPRLHKAYELSSEANGKRPLLKNRTPSHSSNPAIHHKTSPSTKLAPSTSVKQIPSQARNKLYDAFVGGVNTNKKADINKENTKSPKGLIGSKRHPNLDNSSGMAIGVGSAKNSITKKSSEMGTINPSDPFQLLITKAQQELEKCASWGNKEGIEQPELEKIPFETNESESMAFTVREARNDIKKSEQNEEYMARKELDKWKEFGYLLAESYDQLKKNFANEVSEKSKQIQIISALKEQVSKLKDLLKHSQSECELLRNELATEESIREQFVELKSKLENAMDENMVLITENEKLVKQINASEKEKEIMHNEKLLNEKLVQQLNDKVKVPLLLYRNR